METELLIHKLIWPIIISIVAAFIGIIIALIKWGINSYLKSLNDTIRGYQVEVKDSIIAVNKELKTLQNQIANLTTSNQEVSFRLSALNDKTDNQYVRIQEDISVIDSRYHEKHMLMAQDSKLLNKSISTIEKDIAVLKLKNK